MCCRYFIKQKDARRLITDALGLSGDEASTPSLSDRFNVAPGTKIHVVRKRGGTIGPKQPTNIGGLESTLLHWGLGIPWSPSTAPLVNARAETLWEKPSFRDSAQSRRCLIPASGFYEWEHAGRARFPWLFQLREEAPFFFAAIWDGNPGTCAIITTEPNNLMRPIHHRMPAIITTEQAVAWVNNANTHTLQSLLQPFPSEKMHAYRVSQRVNSPANDDEACLTPDTSLPANAPIQQDFGF